VIGLGADKRDDEEIARIFEIKEHPATDPLIAKRDLGMIIMTYFAWSLKSGLRSLKLSDLVFRQM